MSLLKLPTELDAIIVEYVRYGGSSQDTLSQDTLKSLCHVSKYYRKLAEPLLYQDILISNLAELRMKRLLNTLLDRKDLAKHVKRLEVQECSTSTPDSPSLSNYLSNNDATILSKAKNYMQHPPWKPVGTTCWFITTMRKHGNLAYSNPLITLDEAIALTLMLTPNIHTLQLPLSSCPHNNNNLPITSEFLALQWQPIHFASPQVPLKNLQNLSIKGTCDSCDILPTHLLKTSTTSLDVRQCRIASLPCPRPPTTLQRLNLKNVEISPYLLEELIRSPVALRNLRSLRLSALTCSQSTPLPPPSFASGGAWTTYRYARLTALLVAHLPQLEELACFDMGTHGTVRPITFGSLRALRKLHKLKVDFNLLVHFGTYMVSPLLPPWDATSGLLPKGVKSVHLKNAKTATLMYARGGYGSSEHVWHFLTEPGAPVLPVLEKFTVEVVRDARLQPFFQRKVVEDKMLEELRGAADRAVGRGLDYTVGGLPIIE